MVEACQKAFIINCIGDFGLLLGILRFYWIIGSFEFEALFERFNELLANNKVSLWFVTPCALLLFLGPLAKFVQFLFLVSVKKLINIKKDLLDNLSSQF